MTQSALCPNYVDKKFLSMLAHSQRYNETKQQSFKQRLQFRLIAPQYNRYPTIWRSRD